MRMERGFVSEPTHMDFRPRVQDFGLRFLGEALGPSMALKSQAREDANEAIDVSHSCFP